MIDILKKSTTVRAAEQKNEYVVEESTTVKVEDDVALSATRRRWRR
jgi:hypothetical protein